MFAISHRIRKRMIIEWPDAIADIPSGWALCDGTLGTPNLTDKFIIGAGNTYNPGDTAGSATHTHTFTGDGHIHDLGTANPVLAEDSYVDEMTESTAETGTTDSGSTLPPCHALVFIMKL